MKQLESITVKRGDDTDFWDIRVPSVPVAKCTCRQALYPDGSTTAALGPVAVATLDDDDESFRCFWTPEQTLGLAVGWYRWVVEITGDETVEPPLNREERRRVLVREQELP
jgi:hypothetical protein